MNHLLSIVYNEENRLEQVEITSTQKAYYQYDHDGQRVRKVITNTSAAISQVRKYVGNWEAYQKIDTATNTVVLKRETLHVEDDQKRIALIDTPTVDTLSTGEVQILRHQYSNNLSTASLELDESAAIITYEEYYPYGSTSYQGGRSVAECSLKRYRYTGKERDEETGLNYHSARYYVPWLARWCSVDPIVSEFYNILHGSPNRNLRRQFTELTASTFEYCYANPVRFVDPTGEQAPNPKKWVEKRRTFVHEGRKVSTPYWERRKSLVGKIIQKVVSKVKQAISWVGDKLQQADVWIQVQPRKLQERILDWIDRKANENDDARINNDKLSYVQTHASAATFIIANLAAAAFDPKIGNWDKFVNQFANGRGFSTEVAARKLSNFGKLTAAAFGLISLAFTAAKGIKEYKTTGSISNETLGEGILTVGLTTLGIVVGGPVVLAIGIAWGLVGLFAPNFAKKVNKVVGAVAREIGNGIKSIGNWLFGSKKHINN